MIKRECKILLTKFDDGTTMHHNINNNIQTDQNCFDGTKEGQSSILSPSHALNVTNQLSLSPSLSMSTVGVSRRREADLSAVVVPNLRHISIVDEGNHVGHCHNRPCYASLIMSTYLTTSNIMCLPASERQQHQNSSHCLPQFITKNMVCKCRRGELRLTRVDKTNKSKSTRPGDKVELEQQAQWRRVTTSSKHLGKSFMTNVYNPMHAMLKFRSTREHTPRKIVIQPNNNNNSKSYLSFACSMLLAALTMALVQLFNSNICPLLTTVPRLSIMFAEATSTGNIISNRNRYDNSSSSNLYSLPGASNNGSSNTTNHELIGSDNNLSIVDNDNNGIPNEQSTASNILGYNLTTTTTASVADNGTYGHHSSTHSIINANSYPTTPSVTTLPAAYTRAIITPNSQYDGGQSTFNSGSNNNGWSLGPHQFNSNSNNNNNNNYSNNNSLSSAINQRTQYSPHSQLGPHQTHTQISNSMSDLSSIFHQQQQHQQQQHQQQQQQQDQYQYKHGTTSRSPFTQPSIMSSSSSSSVAAPLVGSSYQQQQSPPTTISIPPSPTSITTPPFASAAINTLYHAHISGSMGDDEEGSGGLGGHQQSHHFYHHPHGNNNINSINNKYNDNGACYNGFLTFELTTGFIYTPSSAETLAMLPGTLQLTECLGYCLKNTSCQAVNFEMGLCVLLSSSAQQNPASLLSSQFPVFTIYAEKLCLLPGDPQALKQKRRCPRAWTFERVAGYEMKTRPRKRLTLAAKEQCMEACLLESEFECRSANWYRNSRECTLSDQDRHSVTQTGPNDHIIKSSLIEHFGPVMAHPHKHHHHHQQQLRQQQQNLMYSGQVSMPKHASHQQQQHQQQRNGTAAPTIATGGSSSMQQQRHQLLRQQQQQHQQQQQQMTKQKFYKQLKQQMASEADQQQQHQFQQVDKLAVSPAALDKHQQRARRMLTNSTMAQQQQHQQQQQSGINKSSAPQSNIDSGDAIGGLLEAPASNANKLAKSVTNNGYFFAGLAANAESTMSNGNNGNNGNGNGGDGDNSMNDNDNNLDKRQQLLATTSATNNQQVQYTQLAADADALLAGDSPVENRLFVGQHHHQLQQLSQQQQQQQLDSSSSIVQQPAYAIVDYLENNCIYEPNKLCEFRKLQNRILKTVDSIYQDIQTLDECKQKCINAPYRCYSFDFGDTANHVCRTSHLDQSSLTTVQEPYLEVMGAITYELASCYNVSIACRAREMVAKVKTSKMFNGKIYVKSRPKSCVNDIENSLEFEINMRYNDRECDVKSSSTITQGVFSNDIVIQHHDRIVTTQDVGLSIHCQYDLTNKNVTNNVNLAIDGIDDIMESKNDLTAPPAASPNGAGSGGGSGQHHATPVGNGKPFTITSLATTVVRSPNITMSITNIHGQPISTATVGDRLALMFEIRDKSSPFGIFVREIVAVDGKTNQQQMFNNAQYGTKSPLADWNDELLMSTFSSQAGQSILLVDSLGCPTDSNIMGPLTKMDQVGRTILAPFDAFKFPTSDVVLFKAVVTTCVSECESVMCGPQSTSSMSVSSSSSSSSSSSTGSASYQPSTQAPPLSSLAPQTTTGASTQTLYTYATTPFASSTISSSGGGMYGSGSGSGSSASGGARPTYTSNQPSSGGQQQYLSSSVTPSSIQSITTSTISNSVRPGNSSPFGGPLLTTSPSLPFSTFNQPPTRGFVNNSTRTMNLIPINTQYPAAIKPTLNSNNNNNNNQQQTYLNYNNQPPSMNKLDINLDDLVDQVASNIDGDMRRNHKFAYTSMRPTTLSGNGVTNTDNMGDMTDYTHNGNNNNNNNNNRDQLFDINEHTMAISRNASNSNRVMQPASANINADSSKDLINNLDKSYLDLPMTQLYQQQLMHGGAVESYGKKKRKRRRRRRSSDLDGDHSIIASNDQQQMINTMMNNNSTTTVTPKLGDFNSSRTDTRKRNNNNNNNNNNFQLTMNLDDIKFHQLRANIVDVDQIKEILSRRRGYQTMRQARNYNGGGDSQHNGNGQQQPVYEMDELVVQSIRIVDKLHFDENDPKNNSNNNNNSSTSVRARKLQDSNRKSVDIASVQVRSPTVISQAKKSGDQKQHHQEADDGDDLTSSLTGTGDIDSNSQTGDNDDIVVGGVKSTFNNTGALSLIIGTVSFVFVQIFFVLICFVSWNKHQMRTITPSSLSQQSIMNNSSSHLDNSSRSSHQQQQQQHANCNISNNGRKVYQYQAYNLPPPLNTINNLGRLATVKSHSTSYMNDVIDGSQTPQMFTTHNQTLQIARPTSLSSSNTLAMSPTIMEDYESRPIYVQNSYQHVYNNNSNDNISNSLRHERDYEHNESSFVGFDDEINQNVFLSKPSWS